jgi:hypothetical protein
MSLFAAASIPCQLPFLVAFVAFFPSFSCCFLSPFHDPFTAALLAIQFPLPLFFSLSWCFLNYFLFGTRSTSLNFLPASWRPHTYVF